MTTIPVNKKNRASGTKAVLGQIDRELETSDDVTVLVIEGDKEFSPHLAGEILGFSRQHVVRLIEANIIQAHKMPESTHWRIPLSSIQAFQEKQSQARELTNQWSRDLDEAGIDFE